MQHPGQGGGGLTKMRKTGGTEHHRLTQTFVSALEAVDERTPSIMAGHIGDLGLPQMHAKTVMCPHPSVIRSSHIQQDARAEDMP